MVLSLAFILAFVFSAIVLLIGIIIFSEIADAMELTLPIIPTQPPLPALSLGNLTANDEWQLREQQIDADVTVADCRYGLVNNVLTTQITLPAKGNRYFCDVFKVFDKADIIGKTLSVTWQAGGDQFNNQNEAICVLDGAFDRNNATQFPPTNFGANLCGQSSTLGRLHFITQNNIPLTTDSIVMTLAGSTQEQVTIFVLVKDSSASFRIFMSIHEISISELAKWDWDSPPATLTMAVTGTNNDLGVTNPKLSNLLPTPQLPSDQQQELDTFNNAKAIGFTVIGILPVALFFALFSIFSGKIE